MHLRVMTFSSLHKTHRCLWLMWWSWFSLKWVLQSMRTRRNAKRQMMTWLPVGVRSDQSWSASLPPSQPWFYNTLTLKDSFPKCPLGVFSTSHHGPHLCAAPPACQPHFSPVTPLTSQPNTFHPFFGGGEKWNNFVMGSPGGFVISCLCMIILCCPASRNSGLPNADRW